MEWSCSWWNSEPKSRQWKREWPLACSIRNNGNYDCWLASLTPFCTFANLITQNKTQSLKKNPLTKNPLSTSSHPPQSRNPYFLPPGFSLSLIRLLLISSLLSSKIPFPFFVYSQILWGLWILNFILILLSPWIFNFLIRFIILSF